MTDRRMSADIKANTRQDGIVIEVPIQPGGIQTVVVLVLGEDGRLHVAGPMSEPHLMQSILKRAGALLHRHQETKLVQPVPGIVGVAGKA